MKNLVVAIMAVAVAASVIGCKKEETPAEKMKKSAANALSATKDAAKSAADAMSGAIKEAADVVGDKAKEVKKAVAD